MEKKILEYYLQQLPLQQISMPSGAEILSVQNQMDKIIIYALVNETEVSVWRTFDLFATGEIIDDFFERKYIGTVQLEDGTSILHLFERAI